VSIRSRFGVATAAVFLMATAAGPAFAQGAGCTGGGKISKQIAKPMDAANKAIQARRWQEVLSRVREAENTTGYIRSAFDQFYMYEFKSYAYHQLNQLNDAARELEAGLNSPCMAEAKKPERLKNLAGMYYQLRNYPKAIEFANRGLKLRRDPELMVTLGQSYYQTGNNKEAQRVMGEVINAVESQGQKPKENTILTVLASCQKVNDNNCVTRLFEKLVVYYPKPEYWQNLMAAFAQSEISDEQRIHVMRLSNHVGVMKKPSEYTEMAQIALDLGLPGEAQAILEQAFTKKLFTDQREIDKNTRLLNLAKTTATKDKAAMAAKEVSAKAAATGDADVQLGAAYLGYGENEKAVEALKRGIAKGKLTDADRAGILLGIANLKVNNKAEAAKSFRTVKTDPTMTRIAKLWLLNT
jgi:tetratricopeptide (TPR) repeat protein